jgi:type IV pilus assembly protein PilA
MKRKKKRLWPKGYTLMELIIVLIIVGLLSAVAIPTIGNMVTQSRVNTTQKEMVDLVKAMIGDTDGGLRGFVDELGTLPANLTALHSIGGLSGYNPFTRTGWNGPYIDTTRKDVNGDGAIGAAEYDSLFDAWGNSYIYNAGARTITSYGPNGVAGGGDDVVVPIEN